MKLRILMLSVLIFSMITTAVFAQSESSAALAKASGNEGVFSFASQLGGVNTSTENSTAMTGSIQRIRRKNPQLAFLMSFVVPGVGQYYNGHLIKGVIQEGMVIGGFILLAIGEFDIESDNDDSLFPRIGLGIGVAGWLWSIIDAPLSSIAINRKARLSHGHLFEYHTEAFVLGVDVGATRSGLGGGIVVHF